MALAAPPSPARLVEAERHLADLVGRSSWSRSPDDLAECAAAVADMFRPIADTVTIEGVPPLATIDDHGEPELQHLGPVVRAIRRPDAARRVVLVGHYDTVFDPRYGFVGPVDDGEVVRGPGVVDAKGGLVVAWLGLTGFEEDPHPDLGWELLVVGDEEIGSPGSAPVLTATAVGALVGLGYEPAMPNGALAGPRPASMSITHLVSGRAAHAGCELLLGRNAVVAAGRIAAGVAALTDVPTVLANPGVLHGGSAANIVPATAVLRSNLRMRDADAERAALADLDRIERDVAVDGITVERFVTSYRPPKPLTDEYAALLGGVVAAAADLGIDTGWAPSGGVCDGNTLAGAGLANVDTLGPVGGDLHLPTEYLHPASLGSRGRLTTELLSRAAAGHLGGGAG